MHVRIETLGPIHVARISHVGSYADVEPCFDRLFRWAASIGTTTGRVLTLSYSDPGTTAADRLRTDACVELRTGEDPPPGIELGPVGGGDYVVCRLMDPYDEIQWRTAGGSKCGKGVLIERYTTGNAGENGIGRRARCGIGQGVGRTGSCWVGIVVSSLATTVVRRR